MTLCPKLHTTFSSFTMTYVKMYFILLLFYVAGAKCELDHQFGIGNESKTWRNTNDLGIRQRIKGPYMYDGGGAPPDAYDCRRPAKCVQIRNATCMGVKLPYTTTTLDFLPDGSTQETIEEHLYFLESLKHIPKCWSDVHPFLCSIYMPKCINDTTDLPSHEMCKKVSNSCRMLFKNIFWPTFIRCESTELFPSQERLKEKQCNKKELNFNITGKCLSPLVPTDDSLAYFEDVDGCGVSCHDPLYYTNEEQIQIQSFIHWSAGICYVFNLFTVMTFLIDWKNANRYPAVIIFYINCCFMMHCTGWFVQFFSDENRDNIICRKDGTLKTNGPTGGNISCAAVFMLVYVSSMAAMVWFVILAYAWHMSFQAIGKIQDRIDKKGAYFHLIAWCLPLALAVIVMAIAEVDGDSMTGICFVGYINYTARIWFLLVPLSIATLAGTYFLFRVLITLIRLKISSQEIISERASTKIQTTIVRMGLFFVFSCAAVVVTFYCHIYEFQNSWKWKQSFENYIMCSITKKFYDVSECKMEFRPSIAKLQLHLLAPFFAGVLMSSWVWTSSTFETWKRFIRRVSRCEKQEEPIKLKKHKVIAQAFAKRKIFNDDGRLSISFRNTHKDPVGLNIDLNSVSSQDFSSTWAAALPKLVMRRDALAGVPTGSISSNRRNSVDSEISFSVRRVSVESRRNSFDSQMSVKIAELTTTRKVVSTRNHNQVHRSRRKKVSEMSHLEKAGRLFRRGSNTSQGSQAGAQILSALMIGGASNLALPMPNMKRRSAIGDGLDEQILIAKMLDERGQAMVYNCDSDDNSSSEENTKKDVDLEAGNVEKDERNTDNEESEPEEETKMLPSTDELERCRSKSSNRSSRSHESQKYLVDETVLKQLLKKSSESVKPENGDELKESYKAMAIDELASTLSSYCPELIRIMQSDGQTSAREISTQTSLPLDILEMEEANQNIYELISSRSSKGTQISPQLKKCKKKTQK